MKRILIGVAVLALAGCEAQEPPQAEAPAPKWTLVRYVEGVHFFVTQPEMIEGRQRIWVAMWDQSGGRRGISDTLGLFDADCEERRMIVLEEAEYDMKGDFVPRQKRADNIIYPSPDTVLHDVMEMACGREQIVGPGFDTIRQAKASETLKEIEAAQAAD